MRNRTAGRQNGLHFLAHMMLAMVFFFGLTIPTAHAANPDGDLRIEIIAGYNFVVDSNIQTPAGYGPEAAHVAAKICNDGADDLTDVTVHIGDFGAGTPGIYPVETVDEAANGWLYSGDFSLTHEGSTSDGTRYIGTIPPGECYTQYWLVSYPVLDAANNPVWGAANVPEDDLVLQYDIWVTADDNGSALAADDSKTATMRNEISAMANKIWPNGDNKVPEEYLAAIKSVLGWRPVLESSAAGTLGEMEGVWYDLGNVGQGFDNDGDFVPDYNFWVQPVGDPSLYDPDCFRLTKTYGLIIVQLNDGTELLIPFEDRLYFENIPPNNTNVTGLVFYEYISLDGPCSV
jgi:hypothetical protein